MVIINRRCHSGAFGVIVPKRQCRDKPRHTGIAQYSSDGRYVLIVGQCLISRITNRTLYWVSGR